MDSGFQYLWMIILHASSQIINKRSFSNYLNILFTIFDYSKTPQ